MLPLKIFLFFLFSILSFINQSFVVSHRCSPLNVTVQAVWCLFPKVLNVQACLSFAFTLHRSLFRTNVQSENFNSISKVRNVCCPSQLCHYAHRVQLFFCFCAFLRSSQVRSLAGDSRAKQRPEEQQLFTNQQKWKVEHETGDKHLLPFTQQVVRCHVLSYVQAVPHPLHCWTSDPIVKRERLATAAIQLVVP